MHQKMMAIGKWSGCHQMPGRSFFYKGKQFPVCARCTGVLIGNIAAYTMFLMYALPLRLCLAGCAIMFMDWLFQYLGIRKSTNLRRLITGVIGGYALSTIYCKAICFGVRFLLQALR